MINSETINEILHELSEPFHPSRITWRPGALTENKEKALALAYADLRAYQDRLDDLCGLDWSVSYTPWGERIICHLTVSGITRSSTGEADSDAERSEIAGTAAEAQAFKRACAMFGLGRYLYNLPTLWVEYDAEHGRFTDKAKARLNGVIAQHYQRFLEGQSQEAGVSDDEELAAQSATPADETTGPTSNGSAANGSATNGAAHSATSNGNGRARRAKNDKVADKGADKAADKGDTAATAVTNGNDQAEAAPAALTPVANTPAVATTDPLHQKLNRLGQELYGSQWDQVRAHNVKRLTGKQDSVNGSLTEEQLQKLIGGLEKLKQQRMAA